MGNFLDADAMRRQNDTVVRLTVVTTLGLIGSVSTSFLGMNLLAWADEPVGWRIAVFTLVLAVTAGLTLYTVNRSRHLSEFLDALSDERLSWQGKLTVLRKVWLRR